MNGQKANQSDSKQRKMIHFAAVLVFMVLIYSAPKAQAANPELSQPVFANLFQQIQDYHVKPPVPKQLFYYAVEILQHIEPKLYTREGVHLIILYGDKPILSYRVPAENQTQAWGQITQTMLTQIYAHSREMQKLPLPERSTELASTLLRALDQYSHLNLSANPTDTANLATLPNPASIGLSVTTNTDGAFVSKLVPGGPAETQLQIGDEILAIDAQPVRGLRAREIVKMLQGQDGESVELRIRRDDAEQNLRFVRRYIGGQNFDWQLRGGLAQIKIERFTPGIAARLQSKLSQSPDPIQKIILDLRGSRGGVLEEATAIAGLFLPSGAVIAMRGRHPDSRRDFVADPHSVKLRQPLAVLVDGGTASSAEVLATALRDHGRAVLIGSETYGKGIVQRASYIKGLGQVAISWAQLYRTDINGRTETLTGVKPQICMSGGNGLVEKNPLTTPEPERLMIWLRRAPQVTWDTTDCQKANRKGRNDDFLLAQAVLNDAATYHKLLISKGI
jgi:carboxyl-terminal processing protease